MQEILSGTEFEYNYIDPKIEGEMSEAAEHSRLINQIIPLLEWLYRDKDWYIADNLLIIHEGAGFRQEISPDISIFKGVSQPVTPASVALTSWRTQEANRPVPSVVFEIASESTWRNDISTEPTGKIAQYGRLGVGEYFTYDPSPTPLWAVNGVRLQGWRYLNGQAEALPLETGGWMWSTELEAGLWPSGSLLRLCDNQGKLYLSEAQTERMARLEERTAYESERQARLAAEQHIAALEARLRELTQNNNQ
jgi:Uma2 family endonuclease